MSVSLFNEMKKKIKRKKKKNEITKSDICIIWPFKFLGVGIIKERAV